MFKYLVCILFYSFTIICSAQYGSVKGVITDEKNEPITGAFIELLQLGVLKGSSVSDTLGKYTVFNLLPGIYDVKASYHGYNSALIIKFIITKDSVTSLNAQLQASTNINPIRRRYNPVNTVLLDDTVTYCNITGRISNYKKGIKATIKVYKNDTLLKKVVTDRKGYYCVVLNTEGIFTAHITSKYKGLYSGQYYYPKYILSNIHLKKGLSAIVNIEMPINEWLLPGKNVIIDY
ncbi:hypothetical protein CAP35_04355 [Chitinophagaceae bacterium IBVUCB1]|nr:hypothetical protein CAP35_04355 [Chitinophagaceae bacterium IBVUCB1]